MRQIVFKNLNDLERGHKNVFVAETIESEGILCRSERRTVYLIKEKLLIKDPLNLEAEVKRLQNNNVHNRQVFIHKKLDDANKIKEFAYTIIGRLYVVVAEEIFSIAFKHTFRLSLIDLSKEDDPTETKDEVES